jgi:hypothetical protein
MPWIHSVLYLVAMHATFPPLSMDIPTSGNKLAYTLVLSSGAFLMLGSRGDFTLSC